MQRRTFLKATASASVLVAVPWQQLMADEIDKALLDSDLVYLSPIKADGSLSKCQAEIWYVMVDRDLYVCSRSRSWRVRAPRKGIVNTQFWVGDLGVWKRAKYQTLPKIKGIASIETDEDRMEAALQQFGKKYPSGWGTWGPRFRKGLKEGNRTMIRYRLLYPSRSM